MFLSSESYYSTPLPNLTISCLSGLLIPNATLMFRLLSYSELSKVFMLLQSQVPEDEVHEEICRACITGILHFDKEQIDYKQIPAGIITHIGGKIFHHSTSLTKDIQGSFESLQNTVTIFDQLHAFVARYTNTPIKEVRTYPLDILIKEYGIIQSTFPNEIMPIVLEEEQYSKVGG